MQPLPLSPHARRLVQQLESASHQPEQRGHNYHVSGMGAGFYFAYEQLRNVAQYREHHLLLRSAIERYLLRYVNFDKPTAAAADLLTELTQAGYLKNDSVSVPVVEQIDATLRMYNEVYDQLVSRKIDKLVASKWLHETASVHIETLISPDPRSNIFMQFAYEHFFYAIDREATLRDPVSDHEYRIALFCAVQRAIFKSDMATTRYYCTAISLPDLNRQSAEHVSELNRMIDELYQGRVTNKLFRLINRYGAPIRILRELILELRGNAEVLTNRAETIARSKEVCAQEYARVRKGLNARIVKSILFILVTKTLIGVAIEVPYDLFTTGMVAMKPLLINIAFPLVYMAMISYNITTPGRQNTEVIADYIDRILYDGGGNPIVYKPKRRMTNRSLLSAFTAVYAIGFVGSLALLLWILEQLQFNIVNGMIFFLFFSAVSFLGFRLRQSAHELAIVDEREGLFQTLLDFLGTPFVRVGHWLSDTYAKANIVTALLDLAIEMPIKTTLRLVRQWASFMRDKQEEI